MKGQGRGRNKNRHREEKSAGRDSALGWPPNDAQNPGGLSPSPPRAPSCPEHRVDCHRRHQEAQGPWHSYKAGASLASTRADAAACEQRLGWGQLLGGLSPPCGLLGQGCQRGGPR